MFKIRVIFTIYLSVFFVQSVFSSEEGIDDLINAANQGDVISQYKLGSSYENGQEIGLIHLFPLTYPL